MKHHETLAIRCNDIGARCGDIGAHVELLAILARSFRRYRRLRSWYNRVTNHGDTGTFSKQVADGMIQIINCVHLIHVGTTIFSGITLAITQTCRKVGLN